MIKEDMLEEEASEFAIISPREESDRRDFVQPVLSEHPPKSLLGLLVMMQFPGPLPDQQNEIPEGARPWLCVPLACSLWMLCAFQFKATFLSRVHRPP